MSDESKFKVGDVVALKSGGPCMTVVELDEEAGAKYLMATWFSDADGRYETMQFWVATLEPAWVERRTIMSTAQSLQASLPRGVEVKVSG